MLRVACLQMSPEWLQPQSNMRRIEALLEDSATVDLIVLPEMFTTGFDTSSDHSDEGGHQAKAWMQRLAASKKAVVCGSVKVSDNGKIMNRFIAMSASQELVHYDKVHLFGQEQQALTPGSARRIFTLRGLRILPQVCYDLRFPVLARNQDDYDVIINVASWPKYRIHHWDTLLKARAIENQSYVIGVNRVGEDGNDWEYVGHSQVISPMGEVIANAGDQPDKLIYAELRLSDVADVRQKLPYLKDRDEFKITGID